MEGGRERARMDGGRMERKLRWVEGASIEG